MSTECVITYDLFYNLLMLCHYTGIKTQITGIKMPSVYKTYYSNREKTANN